MNGFITNFMEAAMSAPLIEMQTEGLKTKIEAETKIMVTRAKEETKALRELMEENRKAFDEIYTKEVTDENGKTSKVPMTKEERRDAVKQQLLELIQMQMTKELIVPEAFSAIAALSK